MVFVSATRLHAKRFAMIPLLRASIRIAKQAQNSPGYAGGAILKDMGRVYWTVTTWDDEASMLAFRDSGIHAETMPRMKDWVESFVSARWEHKVSEVPGWLECYDELHRHGRVIPKDSFDGREMEPPRSTLMTLSYPSPDEEHVLERPIT